MGLLNKTSKKNIIAKEEPENIEIKQPKKAVPVEETTQEEIPQPVETPIIEEVKEEIKEEKPKEEKTKAEKQKTKPSKDTGGSLIDNLKKEFEVTPYDMITICAKTGFDTLDYLAAISKTSLGLSLRTFNTSYGSSGSGKTTICIQMSANIINNSEKGMLFFFDGEKSASIERLENLGVDTSPDKFLLIKKNTTIEGFFKLLKLLSMEREKDKLAFGEKYLMENPYIVIADSFNAFASEKEIEADAQYNSAMGTSARAWSALLKTYMDILFKYNITVLGIMQKRDKLSLVGSPKPKELQYLRQDESTSGGNAIVFYSYYFFKLRPHSSFDETSFYGEEGFLVEMNFVKCKSSSTNRSINLVFFPKSGFNNFWTNYNLLTEKKYIQAGGWNKLDGYSEAFRTKDVKKLYDENKIFQTAFQTALKKALDEYIEEVIQNDSSVNLIDEELEEEILN